MTISAVSTSGNATGTVGTNKPAAVIVKSNPGGFITKPSQLIQVAKINLDSNASVKDVQSQDMPTTASLPSGSSSTVTYLNPATGNLSISSINLSTGATTTKPENGGASKIINLASYTELIQQQQQQQQASDTNKKSSLSQADQLDGVNDATTGGADFTNSPILAAPSVIAETVTNAGVWHDVVVTKDTNYVVTEYSVRLGGVENGAGVVADVKRQLEPNTAYKFRVAGINACGRGPWSEQAAFVTCQPGFPGAPSNIKISKSGNNAHIYWEPPKDLDSGPIKEYSVYLQTRSKNPTTTTTTADPTTTVKSQELLQFTQIYCGIESNCVATADVLSQAYIDTTSKPAILFRIAAKNEKGYGPATQVRWLQQDVKDSHESSTSAPTKRSYNSSTSGGSKKKKE